MSPRSIRRAAEREAAKATRKAEKFAANLPAAASVPTPRMPSAPVSEAKLSANRSNARLSTGPRSDIGKAASSLNAVKTGLTGRTVLLPFEDAARYGQHLQDYAAHYRPVGPLEAGLVQSIADTAWRLARIPELESSIYALGRMEAAAAAASESPAQQPEIDASLCHLQTFLKYERQLRNLQIQESRLRRHREKDIAELTRLQAERQAQTASEDEAETELAPRKQNVATRQAVPSLHDSAPLPADGFVFSTTPGALPTTPIGLS